MSLGILNVGAGDTKLSFDVSNPEERKRACAIVKDMIRRGFYIVIQTGVDADGKPEHKRVFDFDEARGEYIIKDVAKELKHEEAEPGQAPRRGRRRKDNVSRIDAGKVTGVAVARVAGG